ncbi:MAG: topoisomerase C-terminal repeat-containing protein, partial [Steroidobacteraceae bacterium]
VGRFGPYVKYGAKYVSLKEDDPYTVSHERALEVIRLKQEADAARLIRDFPDHGIQVLNGRYGPYVTDKKKNAKVPKERDPKSLTLEECRAMIAAAPERGTGRFGRFRRGKQQAAAPPAADSTAAAGRATKAAPAKRVTPEKRSAAIPEAARTNTSRGRQRPATRSARKAHAVTKSGGARSSAARKPRSLPKSGSGRARGLK